MLCFYSRCRGKLLRCIVLAKGLRYGKVARIFSFFQINNLGKIFEKIRSKNEQMGWIYDLIDKRKRREK